MINKNQLITYVIIPTLQELGMYSKSAELLLLYTAATESSLGTYIKQQYKGPALGIFQHEPRTYHDDYDQFLDQPKYKKLKEHVWAICGYNQKPPTEALIWNLKYACAMARIHYARFPEPLPKENDFDGLVRYYYKYWGPNPEHTSIAEAKRRIEYVLFGKKHV